MARCHVALERIGHLRKASAGRGFLSEIERRRDPGRHPSIVDGADQCAGCIFDAPLQRLIEDFAPDGGAIERCEIVLWWHEVSLPRLRQRKNAVHSMTGIYG